jgi:UDP-N-acetylmuramate dehydrogenase
MIGPLQPTKNSRDMIEDILQEDISLAPYTTLQLGGPARHFASCESIDQLRFGLIWAAQNALPVQILGGGSNTIFPDDGFPGLVLHIALSGIGFIAEKDAIRVTAAAGEDWDAFVHLCVERGLAGIECLVGIPGQVGATPIQNVGAYGQEVRDSIVALRALDRRSLKIVEFSAEECDFAYRQSRFKAADQNCYIVTDVTFLLRPEGRPELRYPELRRSIEESVDLASLESGAPILTAVRDAVLTLRRSKSMVVDPDDPDSRSAGSFFLNPILSKEQFAALRERVPDLSSIPQFPAPGGIKVPAAWLVEQTGYHKGYCQGNVAISTHHALALVNRNGTTRELLNLASTIQHEVLQKFDIHLEREPVVV